jgi:hypothetical protein
MAEDTYSINGFSLASVRNRVESKVIAAMRARLPREQGFCGCRLCVEDLYAIALNSLPAHYVQSGSLVLQNTPPGPGNIERAVADALDEVKSRPNHPA